jgi:hypothetical protein
MKTEQPKNDSRHPSPTTRLSDKAFYLIALALLLRKSNEPGPKESLTLRTMAPKESSNLQTLQRYLVPNGQLGPGRG